MRLAIASLLLVPITLYAAPGLAQQSLAPPVQLSYGGSVNTVAVMPDGSTLLGGDFNSVNGVPRANLARLRLDGTLDLDWKLDVGATVGRIVVDGSGAAFVAGGFQAIGGFSRYNIAKLDALGHVDAAWDAHASGGGISAIALDNTGNLYVAGDSFSGAQRGLAKLSAATGAADHTWDPAGTSGTFAVYTLLPDNNGSIYVGGYFTNIGGKTRNNLARLPTTGTGAADVNWNPVADGAVKAMALDTTGHLFIGGDFDAAGGAYRFGLAKLSTNGSGVADPDWDPAQSYYVDTVAMRLDGQGSLYIGGRFDLVAGLARQNIARLAVSGTGVPDPNWNPSAQGDVLALALTPSGTLISGGRFLAFDGSGRVGYAAISAAGILLPPANVSGVRGVSTVIATQPDGGVIIGGTFQLVNGVARNNLVRLAPGGGVDLQWDPGHDAIWQSSGVDTTVSALAIDAGGNAYIGGQFARIGGRDRLGLAKLSGNGAGDADASWNPVEPNNPVYAAALAVDSGAVYVGGVFYEIGGQARTHLVKLDAAGSGAADAMWNAELDNGVRALALAPDGSLFVGGDFTHAGATPRNYLAKLSAGGSGSADPQWDPSPDEPVLALHSDDEGTLYVAGYFLNIGGQALLNVARISQTGTGQADSNWTAASTGPPGKINALDLVDGDLYVAGDFNTFQGVTCASLVRLDLADGAVDPSWIPTSQDETSPFGSVIYALAHTTASHLLLGGTFTQVDQLARSGFAEILSDSIFFDGFE
jgi:Domain of unknown function (DUF5122) beta-propeller